MLNQRPWGSYEVLLDEPTYKVKRITVNPGQRLSLQYHDHRDEHWTVVRGSGEITIGEKTFLAAENTSYHIPRKVIHRASSESVPLVFIEVQTGDCREEDIFRIEDIYGRVS